MKSNGKNISIQIKSKTIDQVLREIDTLAQNKYSIDYRNSGKSEMKFSLWKKINYSNIFQLIFWGSLKEEKNVLTIKGYFGYHKIVKLFLILMYSCFIILIPITLINDSGGDIYFNSPNGQYIVDIPYFGAMVVILMIFILSIAILISYIIQKKDQADIIQLIKSLE